MKTLLSKLMAGSWKTTSAGLAMILGSLIHIGFAIKNKTVTEAELTTAITVILGGIGLMVARDANTSSEDEGLK